MQTEAAWQSCLSFPYSQFPVARSITACCHRYCYGIRYKLHWKKLKLEKKKTHQETKHLWKEKGNGRLSSQSSEGMLYSCQSYQDPTHRHTRDSIYFEAGCAAINQSVSEKSGDIWKAKVKVFPTNPMWSQRMTARPAELSRHEDTSIPIQPHEHDPASCLHTLVSQVEVNILTGGGEIDLALRGRQWMSGCYIDTSTSPAWYATFPSLPIHTQSSSFITKRKKKGTIMCSLSDKIMLLLARAKFICRYSQRRIQKLNFP